MRHQTRTYRLVNARLVAGLAGLYSVLAATTALAAGWAVGTNGLVMKSIDGGTTWASSNPTVQTLNGVYFVNDNFGFAVGANGAVAKTTNGGGDWSTTNPTPRTLNDVFFVDENYGWAVGNSGVVLRTTNGGGMWTASTPTALALYGVYFVDQNNGWAVGAGVALRTTNGGVNWTASSPTTATLKGVYFVDGSKGWAVGSSGTVIKTVNGGVNWTSSKPTSVALNSVYFVSATTGFAAGGAGAVLKTINGGTDWTEQRPVVSELNSVFFIDAVDGWAVGMSGVLLKTTNGGTDWTPSTPAGVELNDIFFASVPYIAITVQTAPAGRSFSVDGVDYSTTQTFNWLSGDAHVIATTSPQAGSAGTRFLWTGWSDDGALSHSVAPFGNATFTATFDTEYQLTMNGGGAGGTVTPSTSWRTPGEVVSISATPNVAYNFLGWEGTGSGSYTGSNNPTTVTMNGPVTELALFDAQMLVTVATNPSGRSITVDGGNYTSPRSFAWVPSSTHTIAVTSPQTTGGSRYTFVTWSDGGPISHSVSPSTEFTYTADFSAEYYLTMQASTGGSVTPVSAWFAAGTLVAITASPDSNYTFAGWTGTGSGSYSGSNSAASVTMNAPVTESASFNQNGFSGMPTELTLLDNAPNPFSQETDIRLGLPRAADVTVDLYDVNGRRVFSESLSSVPSGWSTFTLRADGEGGTLASGVYFLRVSSIGQVKSQRLVVIR